MGKIEHISLQGALRAGREREERELGLTCGAARGAPRGLLVALVVAYGRWRARAREPRGGRK